VYVTDKDYLEGPPVRDYARFGHVTTENSSRDFAQGIFSMCDFHLAHFCAKLAIFKMKIFLKHFLKNCAFFGYLIAREIFAQFFLVHISSRSRADYFANSLRGK
jgi:hypothetical protein